MQTWAIAITSSECKSYLTGKQTGLITLQEVSYCLPFHSLFQFHVYLKEWSGIFYPLDWLQHLLDRELDAKRPNMWSLWYIQ